MSGRPVSGFVVPTWAAGVLLAAMVSAGAFLYNRIDSQRDMLIRLDTQLQERDKHAVEYRHAFENKLESQQIYINEIRKENQAIRMVLTPAQLRTIEQSKKFNN